MQNIGTFKIDSSFQLTHRGLVAIGNILKGKVKMGSTISLEINNSRYLLKIHGVDTGNVDNKGRYFIGLLLKNESQEMQIDLQKVKLQEQVAEIFE